MSISRIVNNIAAVNANRNLDNTQRMLSKSIERLSSGLRINRAGDDAAGLSVANRLRTQVEGLNQAVTNASQGINLITTAEGALEETTIRLNRIRQLAVQSANTAVNDLTARRALQDEVFQSIDEITRIANTTQFGNNFLLNGDFSVGTDLIDGQEEIGVSINASPVASTLANGKSFLNIIKTQEGVRQIVAGEAPGQPQILNTGIHNQKDVAVSMAFFSKDEAGFIAGVNALDAGDDLDAAAFFNGVQMDENDVITFQGVLADGGTQFIGSITASTAGDFATLVSAIQDAIDAAEMALFGVNDPDVVSQGGGIPDSFKTTVSVGENANAGRIVLESQGEFINQSSINISLLRDGELVTRSTGVTRSGIIGEGSFFTGNDFGGAGAIGNSITAITGSSFGAGKFDIEVEDVQAAQQKKLESSIVFRNGNGIIVNRDEALDGDDNSNALVLNGAFVDGIYTGGTTLDDGDIMTLKGTNADGTTFQANFTYVRNDATVDDDLNNFMFNAISGLIRELNYRTRIYDDPDNTVANGVQTRFEDALFTFTANGVLELIDDIGRDDSQMSFTLTFQQGEDADPSRNFTFQDDAHLKREGFAESASFRINGGNAVRARAGDVITLEAAETTLEGVAQPRMTFRVGHGFTAGLDKYKNTPDEFVGRLNGGQSVTFTNGDKEVVFIDGDSGGARGVARFMTVDFNDIINVTKRSDGLPDAGRTLIVSTINRSLNFHIGAFAEQSFRAAIGDLTAENLGFGRGSGRAVSDIDISTLEGANEAMRIVDQALDQVNKTRSILGAATNRLESSISNLSVSAENLTASESRIRDADIARETTDFTRNQVMMQAGISVLAQANFQSQTFLTLLG